MAENAVYNYFAPVFWGTKDPEVMSDLMRMAAKQTNGSHFADNLFCFQRNNSMLSDAPFVKSWQNNCIPESPDHAIVWRRYILTMAAFHGQFLEGDFVECGCYQGTGTKTVLDYLGGPAFQKTCWMYDLFEYPEGSIHHAMPAHSPQLHDMVRERFKDYPNVRIIKGFLPDALGGGVVPKKSRGYTWI